MKRDKIPGVDYDSCFAIWTWIGGVGLLAAVLGVFSPAIYGTWVWDDHSEIIDNLPLRNSRALTRIWIEPWTPDYFPLKSTVQWLQWKLWGDAPLGYHLTNLALHGISALLVVRLFRLVGIGSAWLGGFLFALHPVTVESVAWIAELKNVISMPPLLLAACWYVQFDQTAKRSYYALAVIAFLGAALCKTSVVMFPLVLLVYSWWTRDRVRGSDLMNALPFFLIAVVLGAVTVRFQQTRAFVDWDIPIGGIVARIVTVGPALWMYLLQCLWPANLLPLYPRFVLANSVGWATLAWLAWFIFLGLTYRYRRSFGRHILVGLAWFILNLLPVVGLVKMSFLHFTWVADHFAYLSLIGLVGIATAGIDWIGRHVEPHWRSFSLLSAVLLCVAFGCRTRVYATTFVDEERLWRYTLVRNPSAWLAHNNLGTALLRREQPAEALRHFEEAIRLKPDYSAAHGNLESALYVLGRADEAIEHYEQSVRLAPADADRHSNLAAALVRANRLNEAIYHDREALKLKPDDPKANKDLAIVLYLAGEIDDSLRQYQRALAINPDTETLANYGVALMRVGRFSEAIVTYQQALRNDPDNADTHYNLAIAFAGKGDLDSATQELECALRLRESFPEAWYHLGNVWLRQGRTRLAIDAYRHAISLKPDFSEARTKLDAALQINPAP